MITLIHTCSLYTCMLAGSPPAFAIYLVMPELTCETDTTRQDEKFRSTIDLNSVTLADTPWLTDADVKQYVPATNTFILSRAVSFPPVSLAGTAYVVMVDGERHSAGMLWNSNSSLCGCPLPIIDATPEECRPTGPSEGLLVPVSCVPRVVDQFEISNSNGRGTFQEVFKRLGKAK